MCVGARAPSLVLPRRDSRKEAGSKGGSTKRRRGTSVENGRAETLCERSYLLCRERRQEVVHASGARGLQPASSEAPPTGARRSASGRTDKLARCAQCRRCVGHHVWYYCYFPCPS